MRCHRAQTARPERNRDAAGIIIIAVVACDKDHSSRGSYHHHHSSISTNCAAKIVKIQEKKGRRQQLSSRGKHACVPEAGFFSFRFPARLSFFSFERDFIVAFYGDNEFLFYISRRFFDKSV